MKGEVNRMLKSYVAVFTKEEDGFVVHFPDIENAFTEGDTLEEALSNAESVLGVMLAYLIERNEKIPKQSSLELINKKIDKNQFTSYIQTDYSKYIRNTKAVKKTLTIPDWLNKRAEENGIQFSQTLTEALKEKLGV